MILSRRALNVLEKSYLQKSKDGNVIETPQQLFKRLARTAALSESNFSKTTPASIDLWEEKFYYLLSSLMFLPDSPSFLTSAGTPGILPGRCLVLPLKKDPEAAQFTLEQALLIWKKGGEMGLNFSYLPHHSKDFPDLGMDPVAFLKLFHDAFKKFKTDGKRNLNNIAILNIDHPDIEEFIGYNTTHLPDMQNMILFVGISDKFMKALKARAPWDLLDPDNGRVIQSIPVENLWNKIIDSAWERGTPGIIFLDALEKANHTPLAGKLNATSSYGQVPLLDYESCNLGSINLSLMIKRGWNKNKIDWSCLEKTIDWSVRFLDNIIEIDQYVLSEVREKTTANRKIGLGIMGWAELLLYLSIPYDSAEAIDLGGKVMRFIKEKGRAASANLAKERGTFPNWNRSIFYPHKPLRNASITSISPSIASAEIANTSPSIDPLPALCNKKENGKKSIHPILMNYLDSLDLNKEKLLEKIIETGSLQNINELPEKISRLFKTSLEIPFSTHLKHLSAFQKHTDGSVSKTMVLPPQSTKLSIDECLRLAWKVGAKGIVVKRDDEKKAPQ